MPAPTLRVPYETFLERNLQHSRIASALPGLEPALQKALAELLLIRLFDDFQEALSGIAYRLACGTPYLDGTSPHLLTPAARSTRGARVLFETHERPRHQNVKWSRTNFIKNTTKHVLDSGDSFIRACDAHSLKISEMQAVRNRIAHRNASTRDAFDVVLRRYYGGAPTGVSPGLLLLTSRATPTPIHAYLIVTRVIAKDCARAG